MKHDVNGKFVMNWMMIGCLSGALGIGCVAQKADLQKIHKDLDQQISQIRIEKKELAQELEAARAAIAESKNVLSAQKADMNKMQSNLAPRVDLAQLSQQIKLMRERDLPSLYGKFEDVDNKVVDLKDNFEATNKKNSLTTKAIHTDIQSIQTTIQSHTEELQSGQTQTTTLAQQIDDNNQVLNQKLTDFQTAFGQFKTALTDMGKELRTESQRASSAEAKLSTDINSQAQQHSTDLELQEQGLQARSEELSQSITELQEAMKQSGILLGTRLDEQAHHLTKVEEEITLLNQQDTSSSQQITALQQQASSSDQKITALDQLANSLSRQVVTLQDKLDTDTQALRSFLETDVKTSMDKLVTKMDAQQRPLFDQIDALQSDMEALGIHVQADATQVQGLSQSVVKLREAQDVMGSLLGKRGDEIIQQAGRISERMNAVEAHQSTLGEQLQSNTKTTSTHLKEVNASLTSISQSLDQTTQSLSKRLAQQEESVKSLNKAMQELEQLKTETRGQIQQMQAATQTSEQIRQNVEQMTKRMQDLEIHQSELVGKLDSDAQLTTTHLQEVNNGINSVGKALEEVTEKLNSRITNQEKQLNRSVTQFQSVQNTAEISQSNVQHLNDLTGTMNQLQEVITTIGTKLGERVDEHEDRLGQLAQRVNQLQTTKVGN